MFQRFLRWRDARRKRQLAELMSSAEAEFGHLQRRLTRAEKRLALTSNFIERVVRLEYEIADWRREMAEQREQTETALLELRRARLGLD